jgi:hypothetical protein
MLSASPHPAPPSLSPPPKWCVAGDKSHAATVGAKRSTCCTPAASHTPTAQQHERMLKDGHSQACRQRQKGRSSSQGFSTNPHLTSCGRGSHMSHSSCPRGPTQHQLLMLGPATFGAEQARRLGLAAAPGQRCPWLHTQAVQHRRPRSGWVALLLRIAVYDLARPAAIQAMTAGGGCC